MGMLEEIMPEHNLNQFRKDWDTDFAYEVEGLGRFRVNAFNDRYGVGTVMRLIPSEIPTLDQLSLPDVLRNFCYLSKGLVLMTGPTGSGKSTTQAAMINHINHIRDEHIITIEDPIEFVHEPVLPDPARGTPRHPLRPRCVPHCVKIRTYSSAMRDLDHRDRHETADGSSVFGTLHTSSAPRRRPYHRQVPRRPNQIRSCWRPPQGGRPSARSAADGSGFDAGTTLPSPHIREGKTYLIPVMQTSRSLGMQTQRRHESGAKRSRSRRPTSRVDKEDR